MAANRVKINVSGLYFETYENTLRRFPKTLLGSLKARKFFYDEYKQEYFFNRNRQAFDAVLFYYQSFGILRRPATVPENIFEEELKFFEIEKPSENVLTAQKVNQFSLGDIPLPKNRLQRKVWILFTRPFSSRSAKVIELLNIVMLTLSIVTECVKSVPESKSASVCYFIDHVCYDWFFFDFTIRFLTSRKKYAFLNTFSSLVDVLTFFPFHIQIVIEKSMTNHFSFARVLRLLQVIRILKVTRYSSGVRALLYTVYMSWRDLQLYVIIVILLNTLVASFTFFFEDGKPGNLLTSIPEAMWWSVNTFTTVGYGDTYPKTTFGKIMGSACSVAGIIFLGLPVYCLVSNFLLLWETIRNIDELGFASRLRISFKRMKRVWMLESKRLRRSLSRK